MRAAAGSTGVGGSGREPGAALAPAPGENGASGARAHAKPEAVGLRPAPIVRLERPLAHRGTPHTRPASPRGGDREKSSGMLAPPSGGDDDLRYGRGGTRVKPT